MELDKRAEAGHPRHAGVVSTLFTVYQAILSLASMPAAFLRFAFEDVNENSPGMN